MLGATALWGRKCLIRRTGRRIQMTDCIVVTSHNVGGLYNKMTTAFCGEADIYAVQEADLGITLRATGVTRARDLGY